MTQVGVLGSLRYTERENGWALGFGYNLGAYETLSTAPPTEELEAKYDRKRVVTLNDMNHALSSRKYDYRVPEVAYGNDESFYVVQEVFEEFGKQYLAPQLPFVLIGNAFYYLSLRHISPALGGDSIVRLAYERLDSLLWRCEDTKVQVDTLFVRLSACAGLPDVRRLLRSLYTHMTILMVLADPADEGRLRLLREEKALKDALQSATNTESFRFVTLPSCRPRDLASGIRRNRPTFIHFSGHSSRRGMFFEDDLGNSVMIEPTKLAPLLALAAEDGLKGVVMNSCHTKDQATVIAAEVGHVIAMEGPLGDAQAIDFSSQFYAAIGDGDEFQKAFAWALAGCGLSSSAGPLKPVLIRSPIMMGARRLNIAPKESQDDVAAGEDNNAAADAAAAASSSSSAAAAAAAGGGGEGGAEGSGPISTPHESDEDVVVPPEMEFITSTGLNSPTALTHHGNSQGHQYPDEEQEQLQYQHHHQHQQPLDHGSIIRPRPPVRQPSGGFGESEEMDEQSLLVQEALLRQMFASTIFGSSLSVNGKGKANANVNVNTNGGGGGSDSPAFSSAFTQLSKLLQAQNAAAAVPVVVAAGTTGAGVGGVGGVGGMGVGMGVGVGVGVGAGVGLAGKKPVPRVPPKRIGLSSAPAPAGVGVGVGVPRSNSLRAAAGSVKAAAPPNYDLPSWTALSTTSSAATPTDTPQHDGRSEMDG